jgi:hypothetical protein
LKVREPGVYKLVGQSKYLVENNLSVTCNSLFSSTIEYQNEDFRTPILFWPNPASTVLNLESPIYSDKFNFTIFDIEGKAAKAGSVNFSNDVSNIDLSGLAYGKYIIKIGSRSNFVNHPFFVKP